MMEELIAKRYVKAMKSSSNIELESVLAIFDALSQSFDDEKFASVIKNPNVDKNDKLNILLDAVKSANSESINNLIKLLVENGRIEIIPAMAEVIRKDVATSTKTYQGVIYSNVDMDEATISNLSKGLSEKFDSNISLEFVKNDFNGIKVDVDDLGVEINFSKTRINNQMIEHIIKAI